MIEKNRSTEVTCSDHPTCHINGFSAIAGRFTCCECPLDENAMPISRAILEKWCKGLTSDIVVRKEEL